MVSKTPSVTPWSYSSLTAYATCPRRYYLTRISKQVKESQTEATIHGNQVHSALEKYVGNEAPLDSMYEGYRAVADKIKFSKGRKVLEYKFGLTKGLKPTEFFAKDVWCRGVLDIGILTEKQAIVLDWKGLATDTALPTPTGWTTMGDVEVGQQLIGANGHPCTVVGKSRVKRLKCYRLTFDDTTTVVCDEEHLWEVNGEVISTVEIANTLVKYGQKWRSVRLAKPLELPEPYLPVSPYVLGFWLGDGKHTTGEISKPDSFMWDKVRSLGYTVGEDASRHRPGACESRTVYGLATQLKNLGLIRNKHIPNRYLRASVVQREELLRGLMDSDGSVNSTRKQAVFTSCSKVLSDGVMELLCSLGQRPLQSHTRQTGFGKTVDCYPISFRPQGGLNPFSLPRKADRVTPDWGVGHSNRRLVISVDEAPTVDTQCVSVDSPDNTYLCTESMLVTHNTGNRKLDGDQLRLFAGAAMCLWPYAEQIKTGYIWLKTGQMDTETFTPDDKPGIFQDFAARVHRMEESERNNDWPARPSGLCSKWCPVTKALCVHCGT